MTKYRHELKYICSEAEINIIENQIKLIMQKDKNVGDSNNYIVRSLYFDDYMNSCYYDNEDGNNPRYKYRIRLYNGNDSIIYLEKKIKKNEMTRKESCRITKEVVSQILNNDLFSSNGIQEPLLNQFLVEMRTRLLKPVVICEYTRYPYVFKLGNVRITFDCDIRASREISEFLNNKTNLRGKASITTRGYQLMEVKYDDFLPDTILHLISNNHLQQTNFSKYYLCRKFIKEGKLYDF